MGDIIPDYRLVIEIINLCLAIVLGTIAMNFLRKNYKKMGNSAVFLVFAFFMLAFLELLEVYNAVMGEENFIVKSALTLAMLMLIIVGMLIEAKSFKESPYEIVFGKK